jgi:exopolyphosphatase / guanosine-5'-triphosphate,3'-diphosphate pyrophosphatase
MKVTFPELTPAIAAIDVGSNALRALIARTENGHINIIREIREPLRLGEDVFTHGRISPNKFRETEEVFIKLLHLFSAYGVVDVKAIATSAMRDSQNARGLIANIRHFTGIDIVTIDGDEEAKLIFHAVSGEINLNKKKALLMDIGGGSTELSVVINGHLVDSQSFNIGTVRLLRYGDQRELDIRINLMIQKMKRFTVSYFKQKAPDLFIGTGGNLRRIGKLRRKILNKTSQECSFSEIAHMADTLYSMSFIERIRRLELDQNRADVILPATMLVKSIMRAHNVNKILLPKVGLKEGIILSMLDNKPRKFKSLNPSDR